MKKLFTWLISLYQRYISPLHKPCCRYYPSCSEYSKQAIEKHGVIKGFLLAIWRLLRCNPYSGGGVDYVPEKFHLYTLKGERRRNRSSAATERK